MPVAFRAADSNESSNSNSVTVLNPSYQPKDVGLAVIAMQTVNPTLIQEPQGWHRIYYFGTTNPVVGIYTKVFGHDVEPSLTWTWSPSNISVIAAAVSYSGVQRWDMFDSWRVRRLGNFESGGFSGYSIPPTTASSDDGRLVGVWTSAAATIWGTPSGMTKRIDHPHGGGAGISVLIADKAVLKGTTESLHAGTMASEGSYFSFVMAPEGLRPVASPDRKRELSRR